MLRAAAAVGLAGGWLIGLPAPAGAVSNWGVEQPAEGTRLSAHESVPVVAYVEHSGAETVERLDARFARNGEWVGSIRRLDSRGATETSPGLFRSRFDGELDPLSSAWFGFEPMPNGAYTLHVRAHYRVRDFDQRPTPWSEGHRLVIDAPPPPTIADASLTDPANRNVAIAWRPVGEQVPDFTRYTIERAAADGPYTILHETTHASASELTDMVPADGTYRYRITVHRRGAFTEERSSTPAETRSVSVRPDAQAAPPPDLDGDAPRSAVDSPEGEAGRGGGSVVRRGVFSPPRTQSGPARPPRIGGEDPRTAPRAPGDDTFEEALDYGEWPEEWEVSERGAARGPADSGMITIFRRELAMEDVLVPVAGGLVLILSAAHVARFLNP
jgi:hypothetical protein